MKKILIQGAMDVEVALLIEKTEAVLDKNIAGFDFFKGNFKENEIIISKTNIGMSNASCATTLGILNYTPDMIINQGTAGAHSRNAHVGDIIVASSVVNIVSFEKSAMDTGIDYKLWKHTDFRDHDFNADKGASLKTDEKLLEIFKNVKYDKGNLHIGVIGSGDVWNKEIEFIDFLVDNLHTMCEDMETMSVYNVANRFGIPVIGARVISNNEVIKEAYDRNSANNCQDFILSFLDLM